MLLQNEIEIDLPVGEAWTVLTDLERIAPCLPGATLEGRKGDRFDGSVKVKVGPIGAHFRGTAAFVERDERTHRAVISAAGTDPRGGSSASAEVRARLEAIGSARTRVLFDTELDISGKIAQFGRGALADVATRLLAQFALNLAADLTPSARASGASDSARSQRRLVHPSAAGDAGKADLDVISLIAPMFKARYGQAVLGGLLGVMFSWLLFGRRATR